MQMLKKTMSVLLSLIMILSTFTIVPFSVGAAEASADFDGDGTEESPYIIRTAEDWDKLSESYDAYKKSFKLGDSITVSKMIGTASHPFKGKFDGDGHTLTFNLDTVEEYTAPFRYVSGNSVIKNLVIDGTINTSARFAAGVVAGFVSDGTHTSLNLDDIRCNITINSSLDGIGYHGGIIAFSNDFMFGQLYLNGCAFTGKLLGSKTIWCGGLGGEIDNHIAIKDCVFAPEELTFSTNGFASMVRMAQGLTYSIEVSNSYYTTDRNEQYGRRLFALNYDERLDLGFVQRGDIYPVSGIAAYNKGLEFDGQLYTGNGESITVTPGIEEGHTIFGIWYNDTEISPVYGVYSFTMPAEDTTVSIETEQFAEWEGSGTEASPYIIHNAAEWNRLVQRPDYYDRSYKLGGNITVSTMVGSEEVPFTGSFDGDGHSLTFNYKAAEAYTAPFRFVSGGSFKNLAVKGRIDTNQRYAAGLIACQSGDTIIENCLSENEIYSPSKESDLGYGGFIGRSRNNGDTVSNVTMTGCRYSGKLTTTSDSSGYYSNFTKTGAFIGTGEGSASFTDCLCSTTSFSSVGAVPFVNNITPTVTNSYYMTTRFSGQGVRAYYLRAGEGLTVNFSEVSKSYDVSGIGIHEGGMILGGEMIAPSGASVSFTVTAKDGYRVTKVKSGSTELTPDANGVYSVTMPSGDVTINGEFELTDVWDGNGTPLSPYIIMSTDDWNKLRLNPTYNDCYFRLGNDITVDKMLGSSAEPFTGYFDGNGHTMTLKLNNNSNYTAPFRYVSGDHAYIHDLIVNGSATTTDYLYLGGIIAHQSGTAKLLRCRVSADFHVYYYRDGRNGGLVGHSTSDAELTIEGCVFDGSIADVNSTAYTNQCGGFVGQADGKAALTNCLFMPKKIHLKTNGGSDERSYTFVRGSSGSEVTIENCWYTASLDVAQGTRGYTVNAGDKLTLNFGKYTKRYPVTGLFVFAEGMAIDCAFDNSKNTFGGTRIAAQDTDVKFSVTPDDSYYIKEVYANSEPLDEPVNGQYTFTMPSKNVTVNADLGVAHVKVDFGEGHEALAAQYSGKSGYTVEGAVVTMPYHFDDLMTAQWSVLDDLYANVIDPDEPFFEDNGERLYHYLGLQPMSAYDSEEAYRSDMEGFTSDMIDTDTVLYLLWEKPVTEPAAVTVGQLVCGTQISTAYNGNFPHSEPQPEISVTGAVSATNTMGYLWYTDYSEGAQAPENIFDGTVTGGDCYYTSAYLDAPFGYFIDDTELITVNGADRYWYSDIDPNNGALTLVAKVRAVHDLDENGRCSVCGATEKTITLDFGEDHADFVDEQFSEGAGKRVDDTVGKVLIRSISDDGKIYLLTESDDKEEAYQDLLIVLDGYVSDDEVIDKGYRLMNVVGLHPITYYHHDAEAYYQDQSALSGQALQEGDAFYGLWEEPIQTAEFTVERPLCGTQVISTYINQYSSLKHSEPPVQITAPENIILDTFNHPSWLDGENSDQLFEGTIQGGETYYFNAGFNPVFGYYIPNDIEINVNGGTLTGHGSTWINGSVIAAHDYDSGGKCSACGKEHFAYHSLSLKGDIGVNFYLDLADEELAEGVRVDFVWNGKNESVTLDSESEKDAKTGCYKATCYVCAAEMNDEIAVSITIGGASEPIASETYKVRDYADVILANQDNKFSEELITLVKTMLNYGASAQTQFTHNTDALANHDVGYALDALTDSEINGITSDVPSKDEMAAALEGRGIAYYGYSLILKTETTLRFYFKKNGADISALSLIDSDGKNVGEVKDYNADYCYIEVENIPASELSDDYTLKYGDVFLGNYSALSYVKDVLEYDGDAQPIADTVTALYRYNEAVMDYFNSIA